MLRVRYIQIAGSGDQIFSIAACHLGQVAALARQVNQVEAQALHVARDPLELRARRHVRRLQVADEIGHLEPIARCLGASAPSWRE